MFRRWPTWTVRFIRKVTWGIFPEEWRWVLLGDSRRPARALVPWKGYASEGIRVGSSRFHRFRELLFAAVIRLRGDAEVIHWGTRPLSVNDHPKTWGRLRLCQ